MEYRISHTTRYEYAEPVSLCHNLAHLKLRAAAGQDCRRSDLTIQPQPDVLAAVRDYFGNPMTFFALQKAHDGLTVLAEHEVAVKARPAPERTPCWEVVRDRLPRDRDPAVLDAYQFVFDSRLVQARAAFAEYALPSFAPGRPLLEAVLDLTQRIHRDFQYDPRATTTATPLQEVFEHRRGVCQDFAHFQIACLRSLGLAARYVSGYLCSSAPAGRDPLVGADATHAWLSVFCPEHGWIDVDPTNNQLPSDSHIVLAWGRDYDDVSPIKGVILGGGRHEVHVAVDVVRLPCA
jgi:transglutaminase-like putative cysteine protease